MKIGRRDLLRASLSGLAFGAAQGDVRAETRPTRFVIHVSGPEGGAIDNSYAPLKAALRQRGFETLLVHSPVKGSRTPNQDRALAIVRALEAVTDPVAILGVSNEGNFLPLVAAARPVRRLIYINALVPRPQTAFVEVCQREPVAVPGSLLDRLLAQSQDITADFVKLIHDPEATDDQLEALRVRIEASPAARTIVGFYEVCSLKALPDVDNVYISGSADDQIRPEWAQSAARRVLGVDPTVISGAGHSVIITDYAQQVADACIRDL